MPKVPSSPDGARTRALGCAPSSRALVVIVLGLAFAAPAAAQDRPPSMGRADTVFDFADGDRVVGEGDGPTGAQVLVPPRGRRVSLIRPRVHFVPELLKSVERL